VDAVSLKKIQDAIREREDARVPDERRTVKKRLHDEASVVRMMWLREVAGLVPAQVNG